MKCQLKVAHEEEERALVAKMGAERTSEVAGLKGQYETELHGVKEELARVRREGEEARSSAEQQLASETAMKQVRTHAQLWDTVTVCVYSHTATSGNISGGGTVNT